MGGWQISRGGTTYGPYEWTDLVGFARDGRLSPQDLVWQPEFPAWIPAWQVPGLMPTGQAPAAVAGAARPGPPPSAAWGGAAPTAGARPSRRRRLSGLAIAFICLWTFIILAGAGVGTWLALRGDGDATGGGNTDVTAGTDNGNATTGGGLAGGGAAGGSAAGGGVSDIEIETLDLRGTVVVPQDSGLSYSDLTLLTDTTKEPCSATGGFQVTAAHDQGARTPVFVVNAQGNPVLMALVHASDDGLEPSVASTARALVLYDPAMLSLPAATIDSAAERLEAHPGLPALEAAVAARLAADPVAPLDPDLHADLYDQAAKIEADLLSELASADGERGSELAAGPVAPAGPPLLLASTGDIGDLGVRLAAAGESFAYVADDADHATSEVLLGNTTWAIYDVKWTLTTKDGSSNGKEILWRCAPWRVDLSSFEMSLTPFGFKYEKLSKLGDGELTFDFKRNDTYMLLSIAADMVSLTLGVGAGSLNKMVKSESDAAAVLNSAGAVIKAIGQFPATCESIQGKSFDEAAVTVGKYFATHGTMICLAFAPLIQAELKEELITVAGKVITKKMAALATLGYGATDLLAECHALGNASIVSYSTSGRQAANYYPFKANLTLSPKQKSTTTFVFPITITDFPTDFPHSTELEITYGDGKSEQEEPNFEGGTAAVAFQHSYEGAVPEKVQVVLRTQGTNAAVLITKEAQLVTETTTTQSSGINGTWAGVEKVMGSDFATLEITFNISPDGTGTASRGAAGIAALTVPATYRGNTVTVDYQGTTMTGQVNGDSMTLSGRIEGMDLTWELKRQSY